jgi:four helix bundle protein
MFDFQHLDVYQKAKVYYKKIQSLIESDCLNKTIKDQLGRAALSIPLNIAEGSGRFSKPDRKNFFIIARSSVFETVAIIDILKDSKTVPEEIQKGIESQADELSRILYAMIKNLEK